jgi:site-specific recombinase XerD
MRTRASTALVPATSTALGERPTTGQLAALFALSIPNPNTCEAYTGDVARFTEWATSRGIADVLAADPVVLDAYRGDLLEAGHSPATVARSLSALARFYRFAQSRGAVGRSPFADGMVSRPRFSSDSQELGLDKSEAKSILEAARASSARDHALVLLLVSTGLRVSEACALEVSDIHDERGHHAATIRAGKGGKTRKVALPSTLYGALLAHLDGREAGPVFKGRTGAPLTRRGVQAIVKRLAVSAGIDPAKVHPHTFRHAFVTFALDADVPLHRVQDAAGHADPRTTQRYNRARQNLDGHAAYAVAVALAG